MKHVNCLLYAALNVNVRFSRDDLIQQLSEHKHRVTRTEGPNQPCADQFSPDASQTHDCKIREPRRARNTEWWGGLKARQRAAAKWITSPQIERSSCVRKLVPPAGAELGSSLKVGVRLSGRVEREKESGVKECLKRRKTS